MMTVLRFVITSLSHFMPLVSFIPPENIKTKGFLMFSGGTERDHGMKWVNLFAAVLNV